MSTSSSSSTTAGSNPASLTSPRTTTCLTTTTPPPRGPPSSASISTPTMAVLASSSQNAPAPATPTRGRQSSFGHAHPVRLDPPHTVRDLTRTFNITSRPPADPSRPYSLQFDTAAVHHPGTSPAPSTFVATTTTHTTTTTAAAAAASRRSSEFSHTMPGAHRRDRTPQDRSKSMSAEHRPQPGRLPRPGRWLAFYAVTAIVGITTPIGLQQHFLEAQIYSEEIDTAITNKTLKDLRHHWYVHLGIPRAQLLHPPTRDYATRSDDHKVRCA